jgi:spermidine synthase
VLQAGNILGNVAGSLLTGLMLVDVFGTAGALRIVVGCGLVFAIAGLRIYGRDRSFVAATAGLVIVVGAIPGGQDLWLRLHGQSGPPALVAEDATAVAAIIPEPDGGGLRVSVDGKGQSWLPFGGIHSQLGAVPAAIHPRPRRVAIVGLGSGDTAWAAAFRPETERVRVFEIANPERELLARAAAETPLPQLARFLADRRIEIVTADGRNALAMEADTYDLIEADALRPTTAYAGNVYSVEFFELCRRRLRPGGMMCSWAPTPRVIATFCRVFPHVLDLGRGTILVGSDEPFLGALESWSARLATPQAQAYLGRRVAADVLAVLRTARPARPELVSLQPNQDLFPRDEFRSPAWR